MSSLGARQPRGQAIPAALHVANRNLRTLARALSRHGTRALFCKVMVDLRAGGPALVLHKFRLQRAMLPATAGSSDRGRRRRPQPAVTTPQPERGNDRLDLDADYRLPVAQFTRFMHAWQTHPALLALGEGRPRRRFPYTVVVSPHPEHGFVRLPHTLSFVSSFGQRAGLPVSVVVLSPPDGPDRFAHLEDGSGAIEIAVAHGAAQLSAHLAGTGAADHMVQFLLSGDAICPVFAEVVSRSKVPDLDVVLTDMYFEDGADSVHPVLLPGINPVHAWNVDYFLSRAILRASLVIDLLSGGTAPDAHALVASALCRSSVQGAALRAHHVAFPMLCIAETRASLARRRMDALSRRSPLRLSSMPPAAPARRRASVIICTRDNGFLLEQLVESLSCGHTNELADIVVVANRTANSYALALHERLSAERRITLVRYDAPFSFSAQCNLGAAASTGEILLFLNDDVAPVNREWLGELLAPLDEPRVGIVGPLLLYPDQAIQHAGMYLGFNGLAGHVLRGARLPDADYGFLASAPRQVMAVTGAALAIRRADFERLNGFDKNLFALYIQDVDLCLRAHFSGLAVVYNPRAILLHMESTSVKATLADPWMTRRRALEHEAFVRRWGDVLANDPFHNPNFAREAESLRSLLCPAA